MSDEYPKFSDFSEEETGLEGDKKKMEDILNKEILITGYRIGRSKYRDKDYLTLQFENDGDKCVVFTGSEVLTKHIVYLRGSVKGRALLTHLGKQKK